MCLLKKPLTRSELSDHVVIHNSMLAPPGGWWLSARVDQIDPTMGPVIYVREGVSILYGGVSFPINGGGCH